MKPRRVYVSHSNEGFTLTVEEYSRYYSFLASLGEGLCSLSGHRWCNGGIIGWSLRQDWKHSKDLVKLSIDRETADRLSPPESWTWLDD